MRLGMKAYGAARLLCCLMDPAGLRSVGHDCRKAQLRRAASDHAVRLFGRGAKLQHIAEHRDFASRIKRSRRFERCAHGGRTCVIGIVDEHPCAD